MMQDTQSNYKPSKDRGTRGTYVREGSEVVVVMVCELQPLYPNRAWCPQQLLIRNLMHSSGWPASAWLLKTLPAVKEWEGTVKG